MYVSTCKATRMLCFHGHIYGAPRSRLRKGPPTGAKSRPTTTRGKTGAWNAAMGFVGVLYGKAMVLDGFLSVSITL